MEYHPASHNKRIITLVHDEFWDHYTEEISKKPNSNTQMTTKEKYILPERHIKRPGKKVIEHKNIKIGYKSAVRGYNKEIKQAIQQRKDRNGTWKKRNERRTQTEIITKRRRMLINVLWTAIQMKYQT